MVGRIREADAARCLQAQALIERTYLLKDIGVEIFFSGRNSLYLTFKTSADRDRMAGMLCGMPLHSAHRSPAHWCEASSVLYACLESVTSLSAAGVS